MHTVGSYEAKTHPPRLLERVERGETITITRHGKPVAAMTAFQEQEGPTLGGKVTLRDLIDEGRR